VARRGGAVVGPGAAAPPPPLRARGHASALIPAGHGVLALTTFLLAVLAAVGAV
jgi:hypothetical protein